jgi:hypothetical protein
MVADHNHDGTECLKFRTHPHMADSREGPFFHRTSQWPVTVASVWLISAPRRGIDSQTEGGGGVYRTSPL